MKKPLLMFIFFYPYRLKKDKKDADHCGEMVLFPWSTLLLCSASVHQEFISPGIFRLYLLDKNERILVKYRISILVIYIREKLKKGRGNI